MLAIDGQKLTGKQNPYRLLQHKTDPVTLTVNSKPRMKGAREVTYMPVFDESKLLYLNWIKGNLARVEKATDGRVAYLHIPDMGADGIYEFIKWFYPQIRKEGLIVDVRANGGGNVSQWIIERLDNKLLGTRFGSTSDDPGTYPDVVFHGHMVCILNQNSASDGGHLPLPFSPGRAWPADRHAVVGRRGRYLQPRPVAGRRPGVCAAFGDERPRRQVGSSKATESIRTSRWKTIRRRSSKARIRSFSGRSRRC